MFWLPLVTGPADLLVAVDQHAAHERVRLEVLLEGIIHDTHHQYFSRCTCSFTAPGLWDEHQRVHMAEVAPPLPLSLTSSQQKMARHFSAQLAAIGVQLVWREGQPLVSSLPAVLVEREAVETQRGRPAVATSLLQVKPLCRVYIYHLDSCLPCRRWCTPT